MLSQISITIFHNGQYFMLASINTLWNIYKFSIFRRKNVLFNKIIFFTKMQFDKKRQQKKKKNESELTKIV